ncbi:MAG: type III-B CRISPR-associated protein Cas10/Cmr2 [Rhodothermia bacterium]|nr:type III-B CRISPR-associated protein Cas10/Cmr2 [Rhodothermia bacterium]
MPHLFTFTISPVQSFIEQSRKVKDLLSASRILTRLIEAGMKEFLSKTKDASECRIIYPAYEERFSNTDKSYPNIFKAILSGKVWSNEQLLDIGRAVEATVRESLRQIAINLLEEHTREGSAILEKQYDLIMSQSNPVEGSNATAQFFQQLKNFPECYWVFESYTDQEGYADADIKLNRSLAAIKNLKTFDQLHEEPGRKCSLTGTANALFFKKEGKLPSYAINEPIRLYSSQVEAGEGLSALGFLKRFYSSIPPTASTAEVALWDDICSISNEKFQDLLTDERFDHQMLYEENRNQIPDKLRPTFKKLLEESKTGFNTKYYAVIHFDGDQMGKWMSGEYLQDGADLSNFQNELSKHIAKMANDVRSMLNIETGFNRSEKFGGYTVYAGGDDFLGLVNLQSLFGFLEKIRISFHTLNTEIEHSPYIQLKEPKKITFSAGIVVAHYKTPLSEVLKQVRAAEKYSKINGRDAFTFKILKHSGEVHQSTFKWGVDDVNLKALKNITDALKQEKLTNTFIQQLTKDLQYLSGYSFKSIDDQQMEASINEIVHVEIPRLIKRSNPSKENNIANLIKHIQQLWETGEEETHKEKQVTNFIHALHTTDFLSRKL